ncbi:hypothetical protein AND_003869 [Anopheles darlingi]|uniref:Uncharacterized protein n=1 Tax=Anopheles darlingi TaxID=43151 RepID=W5JNH3_ANODA|nr:hypothetical protein AND_003869 [Anopheles darlingi]
MPGYQLVFHYARPTVLHMTPIYGPPPAPLQTITVGSTAFVPLLCVCVGIAAARTIQSTRNTSCKTIYSAAHRSQGAKRASH